MNGSISAGTTTTATSRPVTEVNGLKGADSKSAAHRHAARTTSTRSSCRLAGLLLLSFLFAVLQIFHFHWRLRDNHLSLELSLELPDILEASKTKQGKKHEGFRYASVLEQREDQVVSGMAGKELKNLGGGITVPAFSRHSTGGGSGTLKGAKKGKKLPKYREDLTREEMYRGFNASSIPFVRNIKHKYPNMAFKAIPTSRWPQMDNHTCIPSSQKLEEWDYRAPYALIIGAQKAGSSALATYLYSHSQIVPTRKELHFLSERMDYYNNDFEGIDQERARSHYLQHIKSAMNRSGIDDLRLHPSMHVLDATPMYLPKSDRVPYRILCLCPWARLLVLLREPISRAYSQYNMGASHAKNITISSIRLGKTFDEYIQRDYDTLLELGVLLPENATDSERELYYGSAKESEAWKVYTKLGTEMPIGRSLYAIQLRHWIEAYKAKNQPLRWLVLKSEDMKADTESTYLKVLDFLNLPHELPETFEEHHKHAYDRVEPMSDSVRALLERIFGPYNRQLKDLIGNEWEGIWQYSNDHSIKSAQ